MRLVVHPQSAERSASRRPLHLVGLDNFVDVAVGPYVRWIRLQIDSAGRVHSFIDSAALLRRGLSLTSDGHPRVAPAARGSVIEKCSSSSIFDESIALIST